jgi:hypothetical protein
LPIAIGLAAPSRARHWLFRKTERTAHFLAEIVAEDYSNYMKLEKEII